MATKRLGKFKDRYYIFIVIALVFGILTVSTSAFAQDDYYTLESQAAQLAQEGKFADEITMLDKILQEHPADPMILGMKAHALIALGKNQDALNILDKLVPIADTLPQGFLYHLDRAIVLYHLGRYQEAENAFSDYMDGFS